MSKTPATFFNAEDFVPGLQQAVGQRPLDPRKMISVGVPVENPEAQQGLVPAVLDRRSVALVNGKEVWFWETDSLRALFRGHKQPPVLGVYPTAYNDSFALLDLHVLEISNFFGEPRDAEMKEIYSILRRRPDGRSLGRIHDYMWQAAAIILGTRPLSQSEFEAIMARLERSCRTFERGPTSRNYIAALRQTFA